MKISPVTDYKLSPVLERLQKMQQEKGVSASACSCSNGMVTGPAPCCCGTGKTFFGDRP